MAVGSVGSCISAHVAEVGLADEAILISRSPVRAGGQGEDVSRNMDDGNSCANDVYTRDAGSRLPGDLRSENIMIVSVYIGQVGMFQHRETKLIRVLSTARGPSYTNRTFTRKANDLDHPVVPAPCSD